MNIRRALPGEARPLADLWLRSRDASAPAIPPTVHSREEVHQWFEEVVLATSDVWVAGGPGKPMAMLVLDDGRIDQLYVDPAWTRRGIGGALLEHAKARRPGGLTLWTFQSNRDARRFYEARDFIAVATTTGDNEEQAPDVRYEWQPRSPAHGSAADGEDPRSSWECQARAASMRDGPGSR